MVLDEWVRTYWIWILVGLALAFVPYIKKPAIYYSTLIHEIGHGISSLNPTGGLGAISLNPDSSGENMVTYRGGGLFYIPIRIGSLMAGYAAPIYTGLLFLLVTIFDIQTFFKWAVCIVCVLTIFAIRNLFGALIILLHAAFWGVMVFIEPIPLNQVLVVLGMMLLCRGLNDYLTVGKYSFVPKYKGLGTDFDLLQQEFFLPRWVWFTLFTLFHTAMLVFGIAGIMDLAMVTAR